MKLLSSLPVLVFALSSGFAHALLAADQTPSTTTTTQRYTDGGTTRIDVVTNTPFTHNYPEYYSYRGFNSAYPGSYSSDVTIQHRPIYFPPAPPALGEPILKRRDRVALTKFAPPAALALDVGELFFAPLSTLLFTEDLSRKRREKLDAYHAARASLVAELRAKLQELEDAGPAQRTAALAALARAQETRLVSLELAAEELRDNFVRGSFFESSIDWNDTRRWRLGDDTRWESQIDEIKVMRGAAAFQAGLSVPQRRLLLELAMELSDSLQDPTAEIALSSSGPFLYFSPETSRIRLPAELSPEIRAKVDAYNQVKAQLKKELRDAIYVNDRALFDFKRTAAFKALADQQTARFAEAERLAEELRVALAPLPNPARPPHLALPRTLAPRIATYHREKADLQSRLLAKLEEIRLALPDDRVEFTRASAGFEITVIAKRKSSDAANQKRAALTADLAEFNRTQGQRYTALAREKDFIQAELLRTASSLAGEQGSTKSINQLLKEFAYAFARQETWDQYRDYEIAVLAPGLSPAQRRLLFGAAIEQFDLPLAN